MYLRFHSKYLLFFSYFNETWILSTEFRKVLNTKLYKNPSRVNRVVPFGRTDRQIDMTELIIAFRNFAKAPKNAYNFTCAINKGPDNYGIQRSLHNWGSSACNLPNVILLAPRIWRWLLHSSENLWTLWINFLNRPIKKQEQPPLYIQTVGAVGPRAKLLVVTNMGIEPRS
jgi:hypothetical protein